MADRLTGLTRERERARHFSRQTDKQGLRQTGRQVSR